MRLPDFEPMLATKWPAAFDSEDWWFEVKWDGYRAIVGNTGEGIRARSRRGLDLAEQFPELTGVPLPEGVVIDGEIVAFDETGRPSFSLLQKRSGFGGAGTDADVGVNLVVFDLLFRGVDVTGQRYEERRRLLEELELPAPIVVPVPTPERGVSLFEAVHEQGIEGIVAKRLGSTYRQGRRSPDWRKVSVRHRLRAVVGGYVPGEGGRAETFGSLLVGLFDDDEFRWIGAVGSGFDEPSLAAFSNALANLERPTSPFTNEVRVPQVPVWVEPGIVVAVEYKEWTADSHLRAPVYKGIEIADPEGVTWGTEGPS
ncbi:MAG: non-homologous end-joining DNA ligase [Acidimicrobiia bacterium]